MSSSILHEAENNDQKRYASVLSTRTAVVATLFLVGILVWSQMANVDESDNEFEPPEDDETPKGELDLFYEDKAADDTATAITAKELLKAELRAGYDPAAVEEAAGLGDEVLLEEQEMAEEAEEEEEGELPPPKETVKVKVEMHNQRVQTGSNLLCTPTTKIPAGSSLVRFEPYVDRNIVHHIMLHRGNGCRGDILYVWARTGQLEGEEIPFEFAGGDFSLVGHNFKKNDVISLQIHYENETGAALQDNSGIFAVYETSPRPRSIQTMVFASGDIHIPPQVSNHIVCDVWNVPAASWSRPNASADVVAIRVHAHMAGKLIWGRQLRDGYYIGDMGRYEVQKPQVFRLLEFEHNIIPEDMMQVHCEYDTTVDDRKYVTRMGLNHVSEEMCNLYLMQTYPVPWRYKRGCTDHYALVPSSSYQPASQPITFDEWGQVVGLAVPPKESEFAGDLFVFHRGEFVWRGAQPAHKSILANTIYHLGPDGEVKNKFGANMFQIPHGIYMDAEGNLWATDVNLHQVFKLDPTDGKVLMTLGIAEQPGKGKSNFDKPTDVAVDMTRNRVYVSDGYGNDRVVVFDTDGNYIEEFGSGLGMSVVHSLTLDRKGRVYVCDRQNGRLFVFDHTGQIVLHEKKMDIIPPAGKNGIWSRHMSAVTYDPFLDMVFTIEGDYVRAHDLHLEQVDEFAFNDWQWPHDIEVFQNKVYVAAMDDKSVRIFERPSKVFK